MEVTLAAEDDILLATAAGQASVNEVMRVFKAVIDAAIEQRFENILMDFVAVQGNLSELDLYEIGKTMAEYCVSKSVYPKVAVVGKPPIVTGFGAQVAWNRGLTSMTFPESQLALNWLRAIAPKPRGSI